MDPALAGLPAELQALFVNTVDPILPSAYDSFAAVNPPWKFCFADSFEGNPWRVSVKNELQRLVNQFNAAGKPSTLQVAVSGGNVALQNSQIRDFIAKGCSAIILYSESTTAENDAVKAAYDKGIPVIAGTVTSPYAINFDSNYYLWGVDEAAGIAKALNGTGNVVMVEGIAGAPVAVGENAGGKAQFATYPGIKVVAEVNGNWTPSVTKSAVLQVLATHPEKVDAVWTTGSEAKLVADAFTQAGRPLPLITASLSGDTLGYWNQHKDTFKFYGSAVLPSWNAQIAFRIAVRLLSGQHPKLNTVMVPLPVVTTQDLPNWFASCLTPDSASLFPIAPQDPMPEDLLNQYFVNGAATPPYDYSSTPGPCH